MMMKLSLLPVAEIRAVFSDLDDTLTDKSRIEPQTYRALWELKEKGYWLAVISGRPAGWADCLMRLWPLDAMVFENGAGLMIRRGDKIETISLVRGLTPVEQRARLEGLFALLKAGIPHVKLATDQPFRLCDFAVDFAEEPPFLTEAETSWVMDELSKHPDVTAKLSSIHVNYWCGEHTKVTACEWLLDNELSRLGIVKDNVAYTGDSPNDEPLFAYFKHSIGVANVTKFLSRMKTGPRYITSHESGAGFFELVEKLPSLTRLA